MIWTDVKDLLEKTYFGMFVAALGSRRQEPSLANSRLCMHCPQQESVCLHRTPRGPQQE